MPPIVTSAAPVDLAEIGMVSSALYSFTAGKMFTL
jgi:hypothetical protein